MKGSASTGPGIRTIARGRIETLAPEELVGRARAAPRVFVDLGTGDGSFAYREAKADPEALVIGIDPVAENMRKYAARIGRKPSRGGVDNLLLIIASVEALPQALKGLADRLSVLFPWSGLLRALVLPEPGVLGDMRELLAEGGLFESLINLAVFDDEAYRARQDLPDLDPERDREDMSRKWAEAGLIITDWEVLEPGQVPLRTRWGQHLSLGSGRRTLRLSARSTERENGDSPDER